MDLNPDSRRERIEAALGNSWQPMALAGRFDSQAIAHPDRWSRQLARGLHEIGVRPGERVALVVDNRPEFVAVKLAVARLGAVAVPVNFSYRADELAAVLNSCEASVLISIDAAIGVDRLAVLDELVPGWEGGATSDTVPHLRRVVLVGNERRPDGLDLRGLLDQATPYRDADPAVLAGWRTSAIGRHAASHDDHSLLPVACAGRARRRG
jgi:fatty-acyl-CoA synthase